MTCGTGAFRFGVGCDCEESSTGYYICTRPNGVFGQRLYSVDVSDGVVAEVGALNSTRITAGQACAGLAWSSSLSMLLAAFPNSTGFLILEVDPNTGAASTAAARQASGGINSLYGIAKNPVTGTWYTLGDQGSTASLYSVTINATTTVTTSLVGNLGEDLSEGDLAFDSTGVLYGAQVATGDTDQFKIGTINLGTGAISLLGTQVASTMDLSGMAFNDAGDTLYGVGTFNSTNVHLYSIDKTGGAGTFLFELTINSSGFVFPGDGQMGFCKIPEGAT